MYGSDEESDGKYGSFRRNRDKYKTRGEERFRQAIKRGDFKRSDVGRDNGRSGSKGSRRGLYDYEIDQGLSEFGLDQDEDLNEGWGSENRFARGGGRFVPGQYEYSQRYGGSVSANRFASNYVPGEHDNNGRGSGHHFDSGRENRFYPRGTARYDGGGSGNRFASGSGNRFGGGDRVGVDGNGNRFASGGGSKFDVNAGGRSGGVGSHFGRAGGGVEGGDAKSRFTPSGSSSAVDNLTSTFAAIELKKSTAADYQSVWSAELKKTRLRIFQPQCDFGYFTWKPRGDYVPLDKLQSEDTIIRFIDSKGGPPRLKRVDDIRTNIQFETPPLDQRTFKNIFPFGDFDIAGIHVAVQRGLKLEEVDFCFGGSALHMLANKKADDIFIAQRIPGTKCISVQKKQPYEKNLAHLGFQFERHVTGSHIMDGTSDFSCVEHIHTMKVGGKIVLFCAEVDAVNEKGLLVEVKACYPLYWGSRVNQVMFQMMSNGSSLLCHGETNRQVLTAVTVRNFASVANEALSQSDVNKLEVSIIQGMTSITEQVQDDLPFRVVFEGGQLILEPDIIDLFPPKNIVERLIISSEKPETPSLPETSLSVAW